MRKRGLSVLAALGTLAWLVPSQGAAQAQNDVQAAAQGAAPRVAQAPVRAPVQAQAPAAAAAVVPDAAQGTAARCPARGSDPVPDPAGLAELKQVILPAPLLPEAASASILVRKPADPSRIASFKVLIREPGAGRGELLHIQEIRDDAHEDTAEELKITDRDGWYHLVVQGPSRSPFGTDLRRRQTLLLLACDPTGAVTAFGEMDVTRTAAGTAKLLALLVVLILYLGLVTMVWLNRKRQSGKKELPEPQRWEPVEELSWLRCCDPVVLTGDIFDRGSLPKLQILLFTMVVVYQLLEILLRTGILTDISPTVVYLLGIPAIGSIGTQLTSQVRDRLSLANWSWLASRGVLPVNDPGSGPPRWSDLFLSNGELDLYKVQAAAFSTIVAVSMLQTGMIGFREFSVPESLLHILGLSQAVFVGGQFTKAATMGDLDKLIDELKLRERTLIQAARTGIDVAPDGSAPAGAAPAPTAPFATFAAASARDAVPNAAARYKEVADEVKVLLSSMTNRAADTAPLENPPL